MLTERLTVCRADASDPAIRRAAELLRDGKLVAFPTETVYGLGARASDESAARSIFAAKGRPASVPLIVHVADYAQALTYVSEAPEVASQLARAHWPGSLTLVMSRAAHVPDAVTGGGATVGLRAPSHPVALALIDALGEGIAAPSANLYDRIPPVRARHVLAGLDGRIDAVLDGGRCPGGLESTVLDVRVEPPRVVRRGAVPGSALGLEPGYAAERVAVRAEEGRWLCVGEADAFAAWAESQPGPFARVAHSSGVEARLLPADPGGYASEMYDLLHEIWSEGIERVWLDAPPRGEEWEPIWDRLARLVKGLAPPR